MVRYDRHRRRTWFVGLRFHHGMAGALLAASSFAVRGSQFVRTLMRSIGAALMVHDWRDFPWTSDR